MLYLDYINNGKKSRFHPLFFVLLSLLAFILLHLYDDLAGCLTRLPAKSYLFLTGINYLLTAVALMATSGLLIQQAIVLRKNMMDQNEFLEIMSTTDTLTGLSNRRIVDQFFTRAASEEKSYSLIISDIDDFKKFNDTYGHECGDAVLIAVANTFRQIAGANDIVCRWGGEEILMLLPDCQKQAAIRTAYKIRYLLINKPIHYDGQTLSIRMTFGVSTSHEEDSPARLIALADQRLYYGKTHGKNCVISTNHTTRSSPAHH